MFRLKSFLCLFQVWIFLVSFQFSYGLTKYDKKDLENLREEVRQMFQHAYDSYLNYAYPYDELRPLSCDGVDTWGSYSLTLIDALDTLAVMGNYTEFQRVVNIVTANANFDANINVSVFETNIRIIGGLLSAHLLSHRAGVSLVPGWPCNGPLLELAEDVARRLIAAFDTPTGMPYGTVNLQHGVPLGETTVTCTAGVGTFILELGTLSRLTGDPIFEEVSLTALDALYAHRSALGLVGNHVDVATGRWTAQDAGIGAGVDSYYEYLAKGAILLQRPELMHMFNEGKAAIEKYLERDDWHLWVSMSKGQVTLPVFQSLEAYWPGVLSLTGDISKGMKSLHNYHQVWKQYGFTPEFYYIPQGEVGTNRESYPLRPELIESVMYLYRATGDPYLIEVGKDILRSIQHSAKTPCGYATIKDVRDHRKEDRMESFFLAETTKYLYLLFDPDNFLHNHGQAGTVVETPWGECLVGAGGYIFNTEAHPIDPGALHCCSGPRQDEVQELLRGTANTNSFKGTPLATHQKSSKRGPLSKGCLETEPDPMPDLISKAQIAKFANSMLPVKDVLHDTKETDKSALSESVTLEGAIRMSNAINSDASQLIANKGTEGQQGELSWRDFDSDVDDSWRKELMGATEGIRFEALPVQLQQMLSAVGKAHSKAYPNGPEVRDNEAQHLGRNVFKQYNLDTLFNDKNFQRRLSVMNMEELLMVVNNAISVTNENIQKIGNFETASDSDVDKADSAKESVFKPVPVSEKSADDTLGYRADDSDESSDGDSSQAVTDEVEVCDSESQQVDDSSEQESYVPPFSYAKTKFDPQALFERLQMENRYKKNASWVNDHNVLSCPAQPFLQRLSMSGEMFEVP